ncbi:MAG: metallophosphoesterase family protein [Anaerolineales bacterium]|nr:metallophosphoesterase family protein [Anaerolineales bacterium]
MVTLGILSDTHIPDRVLRLNPRVIPFFRSAQVEAILHAGDVCTPGVLEQLGQVAPVYAVRGNRDWLWLRRLPLRRHLTIEGINIGLAHGHGGWPVYWQDKLYFLLNGYHHERLMPRLSLEFAEARVIVFGHGHLPLNRWVNGQLFINPGAAYFQRKNDPAPTVGLLYIEPGSKVKAEIVKL